MIEPSDLDDLGGPDAEGLVNVRGPCGVVIFGIGPSDDPPTPLFVLPGSEDDVRRTITWIGRTPKVAETLREIGERWPDFLPGLVDE